MTLDEATLWFKDAIFFDVSTHGFSDNGGDRHGGLPELIDKHIFSKQVVTLERPFIKKPYQSLWLERESKDDR
jgi:hypothetical protein